MKRKFWTVLVGILTILCMAFCLTGCDLFGKRSEGKFVFSLNDDKESYCVADYDDHYWTFDDLPDMEVQTIVIPDTFNDLPVTSIGERAFQHCRGLTSITIPDSVTSIGYEAFYGCSGLETVTIGSGVTSIGRSAFSGCSGLTEMTIPGSVTSIESGAFGNCSSLTEIVIPNSVTEIGEGILGGCDNLKKATLPTLAIKSLPENIQIINLTDGFAIKESTFSYFSELTEITIPDSVTSIGKDAFYNCSKLASVTIPGSVTSIESGAFEYCSGLTSVNLIYGQ